ncbi:CerR family C-terminal domain-containing protein [Providencia sp. JGM181]|uniref:CerR family C-terminal domain-containing protein n=1 Tax=unclassified Providencia TaxID=2633465 RepID=UPI001BA624EF|nr:MULTISPECIES: CerR family C-terminal domain-containing protein [unclassified Providencia]MBS0924153.1 CerR family C-terminal domain-containing protein [Providencia sp. JGM181]MBS0932577.1 CerR family C-terminal domain-containing protein [Providencia sp. JGM172]MBS0996770.1 CerR family C-terminal domain-containing protein [Providencia sp. JGM178]
MTEINKNTLSSELTKEKLINEGIKQFALYGINGVRTRQLAESAGVNQSAIPYHMGGKMGVYAAVIHKIAADLAQMSNVSIFDVQFEQLKSRASHEVIEVESLLRLLIKGLGLALLSPEHEYYSILILREQLEPTENADIIFKEFIEPFHSRLTSLVQFITDKDQATAIISAHALIGQVLGFVIAKKSLLKRLNQKSLDKDLLDKILEQVSAFACNAIISR